MKDVLGNKIEVGCEVVFHPKGLASVSDHLAVGKISRITEKRVYVEYECEHHVDGRYWGKRVVGMKEYPRSPEQVYVIGNKND